MDINLEDYFDFVEEPQHSKGVLIDFQEKYKLDSEWLYKTYKAGEINYNDLGISKDDYYSWLHHYIIFVQNEGNVWDLKRTEEKWEDQEEIMDKRGELILSCFIRMYYRKMLRLAN